MISFSKLGNYGRLGNQLFQYAFLRTSAQRLGTGFHCPAWDGDDIFDLADDGERAQTPSGIVSTFDSYPEAGFNPKALGIADHTDIEGFFQSDKYYPDKAMVRRWYSFRPAIKDMVDSRYSRESMRNAVSLSLRIDDDYKITRNYFPLYPVSYYEKGLREVAATGRVLVFSDRPDLARAFFKPLREYDLDFVTGLNGPEQLYLMTQCRANIITNSTFSWWGAWLNTRSDRITVAPSAWCRPGIPNPITHILSDEWLQIRGTVPVWDNFHLWRIRHPIETIQRVRMRSLRPG